MYWPEMNLTFPMHILVLVEQSNEWGGTVSWTISGTNVRHVHSEEFGYFDETTTITREGSGTVQLVALPGRANPAVATLDPSSIVAGDHYKRVVVTITRGNGCESTRTETTDVEGAYQETFTNPDWGTGGEVSILFGEGNEYAISFVSVQWDEEGTYTTQTTTVCEGDGDDLPGLPVTTPTTYRLGPEMAGGFNLEDGLYHTTLNPATPHILEGHAPWRDGIMPWTTTEVTWSITRPQ
jgi:hypothetical protein